MINAKFPNTSEIRVPYRLLKETRKWLKITKG